MTRRRRKRNQTPASLEARYVQELAQGGQRDDMLQALCRIADELKRRNDAQTVVMPPNIRVR